MFAADGSGPVEGAQVRLESAPRDRGISAFPRAVTGVDGSYLLTGVPPGQARLVIEKPVYATVATDLVVEGDMDTAPVVLEAERPIH